MNRLSSVNRRVAVARSEEARNHTTWKESQWCRKSLKASLPFLAFDTHGDAVLILLLADEDEVATQDEVMLADEGEEDKSRVEEFEDLADQQHIKTSKMKNAEVGEETDQFEDEKEDATDEEEVPRSSFLMLLCLLHEEESVDHDENGNDEICNSEESIKVIHRCIHP